MFVTVKYGEDQSRIFNINCRNEVLLYQIKKRCDCEREDVVDLADEQGSVKNLWKNLEDYGTDYLKERENLILLKVNEKNLEEDETAPATKVMYVPMLIGLADNQVFMDTLNPKKESIKTNRRTSVNPEEISAAKTKKQDKKKQTQPQSKTAKK